MEIYWVNGQYQEDERIFDSQFEVYEWTDSLYQDFSNGFLRKENIGFATPDVKVMDCLTELIQQSGTILEGELYLFPQLGHILAFSSYKYLI